MRTLTIVLLNEPVKHLLLLTNAALRGTGRRLLQSPVHPFVPAILLRVPRLYPFRFDAQFDKPDR